jgi:DNA-binding transcriptional MerR regulator
VSTHLGIGSFAQATHLSIKTLRRYHESGLLEPADVNPQTGYRSYTTAQIPTAQIIRRFRDLDMPLPDIRAVLAAPNVRVRNDLIAGHLNRLEQSLARTQNVVASLRDLLDQPVSAPTFAHRNFKEAFVAAITEVLDVKDALSWLQGALGELQATVAAQRLPITGHAGGIFSNALFSEARGEATIFLPCVGEVRRIGRVVPLVVPATEAAIALHIGSHNNIDLEYGALATYVTQHALAVDGPIREYYVVGPQNTLDETEWRTEIAWPIFQTRHENRT